ncbi:hypothetical protein [Cellulomonas sp. PhB150]|uniref:hypothetical protein n=1 Tax=Cellulomonas sp. PhB150 TaxID=2485188 RepID=UPI000F470512|nr:hypothetical protein [Cellulomonas sp. PhB150]ROS31517.1 hypothetical protein EDF34_1176 [Cellulomonas sp. PhB150]
MTIDTEPARRAHRPDRSSRTGWVVVAVCVVVAVVIALVATHPWSDDDPSDAAGGPATQEAATVARGTADASTLTIAGSAQALQVTADADDDDLLRADSDGNAQPTADGDRLQLNGGLVHLRLAPDVAWTLAITEGMDTVDVNLTGGRLAALELRGGARLITLTLPKSDGAVTIDQAAGAQDLVVHLPQVTGARASVTSGVGTVLIDGKSTQGVGAGTDLETDPLGDDYYQLKIGGGLGTLRVDHPDTQSR